MNSAFLLSESNQAYLDYSVMALVMHSQKLSANWTGQTRTDPNDVVFAMCWCGCLPSFRSCNRFSWPEKSSLVDMLTGMETDWPDFRGRWDRASCRSQLTNSPNSFSVMQNKGTYLFTALWTNRNSFTHAYPFIHSCTKRVKR